MIRVSFPDGSVRELPEGSSPLDVAQSIGPRLAQAALSAQVNGTMWDLTRPLPGDCALRLLTFADPEGREVYRHSSTHLMAQAVKALYPDALLTVGPALEDRFYYDIDMEPVSDADFAKIEEKMAEFAKADLPITREEVSREEAKVLFADDPYKIEVLAEIPEGETVTIYRQGDWFDLCRGPHLPSTGKIKAFKLLSAAGAFWRADAANKQLQRLYGTSYPSQKELDEHLKRLEEAKARDHRKLGRELGLFMLSPDLVGPGLPLWLPKGAILRGTLENWLKEVQFERGYQPVITPHIAKVDLYKASGHWDQFRENMFAPMIEEGVEYVLRPVNCPHHIQIYKHGSRSYRDLPLRLAEFGTTYRHEQTGELSGLTRVRGFTVDDSHIFCRPDQLVDEFKEVVGLIMFVFDRLGLKDFRARVGLRDPASSKYIGTEEGWRLSTEAILSAVQDLGLEHTVAEGEAAMYGPKLDFVVRDALGREWQLGTCQVDYSLPDRFALEYTGSDGQPHRPVMIHRAPFGSLERFIGVLIEHFAGAFPLWLAPVQLKVLPIADRHAEHARTVASALKRLASVPKWTRTTRRSGPRSRLPKPRRCRTWRLLAIRKLKAAASRCVLAGGKIWARSRWMR
jgi:threonyl-tRNA synthetase